MRDAKHKLLSCWKDHTNINNVENVYSLLKESKDVIIWPVLVATNSATSVEENGKVIITNAHQFDLIDHS